MYFCCYFLQSQIINWSAFSVFFLFFFLLNQTICFCFGHSLGIASWVQMAIFRPVSVFSWLSDTAKQQWKTKIKSSVSSSISGKTVFIFEEKKNFGSKLIKNDFIFIFMRSLCSFIYQYNSYIEDQHSSDMSIFPVSSPLLEGRDLTLASTKASPLLVHVFVLLVLEYVPWYMYVYTYLPVYCIAILKY